jgi:hypothetical protein
LQLISGNVIANLSISYPFWFLILVVFMGLVYASILYVRNRKQKFSVMLTAILFGLRFLIVSVLCFLLLSPFVKTRKRYTERPIVILGVDNSKSIVSGADSSYFKTQFNDDLGEMVSALEENYAVETVLFGEQIRMNQPPDFNDELSNYSGLTSYIRQAYDGLNVGALLIAGDGISNRGIDPEFAAAGLGYPVYTLAFGDTIRGRDLNISDTRYNSIVYQGDDFPLEVSISATNLAGQQATIKVSGFGKELESKKVKIEQDQYSGSFLFTLNAIKEGKHRINISVVTGAEELSEDNNRRDIFIDVLRSRQKILVLANSPHPDISAIRSSLEQAGKFEVEVQYPGNFRANVIEYDLIILHQLPSFNQSFQGTLNDLREKNSIPMLFILGKQSSFNLFNRYFDGIDLRANNRNLEEAQFIFNPRFTSFSFNRELADQLTTLPPLIVPFGNYRIAESAEVFGFQRLNRIDTDLPLVVFNTRDENRMGLIAGEGLWLWRMHTYLQFERYDAFDSFFNKTVQYLMVRRDKRNFRIVTEGEYNSNDRVIVTAELYNPSFEAVNEPDVNFRLTNEEGDQFNYLFSPEGEGYTLDLGQLPVGVYSYLATTRLGKEDFRSSGEFIVTRQSLEIANLNADHGMLFRMANNNGGALIYPAQISAFPAILGERNDLRSKIYYEEKYSGLNDIPWIIGLILFLLTIEWVLRKYFGSY